MSPCVKYKRQLLCKSATYRQNVQQVLDVTLCVEFFDEELDGGVVEVVV